MEFKDLLTKSGFDLSKVLVVRHTPFEAPLRRILPWLAAERPDVFNAYQQSQNPAAEKALQKAHYLASFIGLDRGLALFVGLYKQSGSKPITDREFWAIENVAEMKPFGLTGVVGRETCQWFNLELQDFYQNWKGRLVVKWPVGRSWWRWANEKNKFAIHAIHVDSLLDAEMPPWDRLSLTWDDLKVLPVRWQSALKHWRGVYHILDRTTGKGYVGSACGEDNILGRWKGYADSGHGGNKKLKELTPSNFVFTILQRTSPDLVPAEIVQIEESWKARLHTREYGLNEN